MRALKYLLLLSTAICQFTGCNDTVKRIVVSGNVLVDGKPLTEGTIRFVPEKGRAVSSAILSDGSFQLGTNSVSTASGVDGVAPGKYRIAVSASKILNDEDESIEWLAPSHYADFSTSGLVADLQASKDDLLIELTWEGSEEATEASGSTAEPTESDPQNEVETESETEEIAQEPSVQSQEQ